MQKKLFFKQHAYVGLWLAALVVVAGVLLTYESHLLWKIQEKNLFLCSVLFFKEQLVVPGGLLTWVGTWFTQFLYIPWVGVLMLCCWWWLLMIIVKRAFGIPNRWAIVMLIPVALLLTTITDQGYWIYMLKLRGHFFVSTIGTTAVAALLWGFRCVMNKYSLRAIYIFLTCAVGYPLMGIYGLAAALLMGIWSWRLSASRIAAVIHSVVAVVSIAAVPLFCYRYIYYQVNLANILWAELPLYFITENHPTYYIPYYLLALFFVVLVVTSQEGKAQMVAMTKTASKSRKLLEWLGQGVIAILLVAGVYTFWMKDENFHHELAMQHHISNLDWNGVLDEAVAQKDEPTRAIVMMRNLALSRLGKQGDLMFFYKNGSKAYDAPFGMRLMLVVGPMIYYQYGMLNYCNRLCVEMGVEFGFRAEDYKLLVNCAILDNDQPLARKYIGILKQTMFFSDWAQQAEKLLGHPELIAQDAEREPITHMLHYNNVLGGDQGDIESFLMRQLARSTYTDDPLFQEQTLLATLWTKDVKRFWYHFSDYVKLHPQGPIPRYYQEAAYLYIEMEESPNVGNMPFSPGIKEGFERFATTMSNYDGRDVAVAREELFPFFGDTYYYDYYTMSNLPEY
ncbi:MAG: hypothetical protein E7107_00365 [Prevotella sp.]|jgi:hypothetical protein|nr:hypothetical protein [Prevotella sp.]